MDAIFSLTAYDGVVQWDRQSRDVIPGQYYAVDHFCEVAAAHLELDYSLDEAEWGTVIAIVAVTPEGEVEVEWTAPTPEDAYPSSEAV